MAQCHADGRKHPSAMDMYVGVLHSKLYSPNRDVDKYPHWSRYNTTAGGYNRTAESFRKEPTSDSRPSLLGGSFREDTLKTVAALPKVDPNPSHEAKSLRNGSYIAAAGPDNVLQKKNKGGELLLQTLDLPHDSSNDSLAYRRNGNSMEKESKLLPTSKDAPVSDKVSNVSNPLRKEKEDLIINARGFKSSDSQPINWEAKCLSSDAASVPRSGAATGNPRNQIKSEELDAVNNCNGMLKSRNSNEQANNCIRIHKSAEQSVAYTNKGRLNEGNLEGGTRLYKSGEQIAANCRLNAGNLKEPPNGGLIVGSLKVGGYSSADSSSSIGGSPTAIKDGGRWSSAGSADSSLSIGGSPTAKDGCRRSSFSYGGSSDGGNPMAKDVWRRSSTGGYGSADSSGSSVGSPTAKDGGRRLSTGSILNNKDCPTSASVRGMGNILGGGNMGKSKVSSSKASCNDPLRSGDSPAKKSDDMVLPNCNANVRGLSTPRVCVEGSLNGNLGNLCPGHWNAHASNGNILSHGLLVKTNNKLGEGIRNGCELDDPEDIKNAGNEQYKKGHFLEAVALYDKSIAMCPNHAPYRSNRAAALTGLGRLGEAVQECEEAIRLDPQYSRAHLRAAHLYLRLGLIESAKRHFQAAGQQADAKDVQSLQTVERHISRCIEGRKVGDWRSVLRESNAAVVAGADSAPQVLGYKSEALLKLHRPEEAEAVCAEAQRLESSLRKLGVAPAESFLHMLRAHIEMSLGRFEGAIGAAESAAQIDPRNPEAVGLLRKARAVGQTRISGNELFNAGRFFEACAVYGEGLESDPTNAVLLCNRAACRSKLGQWEKAIEDCDAALVAQPNYIKALMRRANCSTKLERWEDALRDYEVLRREMPDDMEVARGFFDVQVAIKKARGEEIYKMKFGGDVEEVFDKDQFREVVTSPGLSVVQFITRWDDRCRQISSFVNQLCKRYPCVHFVKVDVDENPHIAKTESVSFVPTFKIYKNGQKVREILGPGQQALEYAIKHYSM